MADLIPIRPPGRLQPRRDQIPWRLVGAVGSVVSLIGLTYFLLQSRGESEERNRLVRERQRMGLELSQEYASLKNRVEQWTLSAATSAYPGDLVDPEARQLTWRERPSIYLRMRALDAASIDAVHAAAKLVALDGLAGCLLRVKGTSGPWSIGELIAHAEALGPDFIKDVRETRNDLRLRQLAFALDEYKKNRFPIARDATKLTEYAIIVLDEDPPAVPTTSAAFGPDASVAQKIIGVTHPLRLSVRRLSDDKELLRLRRTPATSALQLKGPAIGAAEAVEVRRGQVLGCAMANEALAAVGVNEAPSMETTLAPLPVASVSAAASASVAPSASASAMPSASGGRG